MTAPGPPTEPNKTCAMLMRYFGPAAESQALFRAFFCEQENNRAAAQFRIKIYRMTLETRERA